uniref:Uncharacterized protein n=1 Tax=Arundo donax TaxID=35708 RepID=A0A0A9CFR3_ARUDO
MENGQQQGSGPLLIQSLAAD